eukprot:2037-Heterococcus_DN1.PRE.2
MVSMTVACKQHLSTTKAVDAAVRGLLVLQYVNECESYCTCNGSARVVQLQYSVHVAAQNSKLLQSGVTLVESSTASSCTVMNCKSMSQNQQQRIAALKLQHAGSKAAAPTPAPNSSHEVIMLMSNVVHCH